MNCYNFKLLLSFIILGTNLFAQSVKELENADLQNQKPTLSQTNTDSSGNCNLAVAAIKGWQYISFSSSLLNCQFHPCCSNYAIHAFNKNGFFKGILYTADRISRCHPFAHNYYSKTSKGFQNELDNNPYYRSEHLPYFSIPVSFILPGFNKMINGRFYDGLAMFVITEISAIGAYATYRKDNYFYIAFAFIFVSFYSSDIYFNFKSL